MALTITSFNSPAKTSETAAGTTPASTSSTSPGTLGSTASTALYQNLGIPPVDSGPAGLSAPSNPEDSALALAQIELLLNETANKARSAGFAAQIGSARGAIAGTVKSIAEARSALSTATAQETTDKQALTHETDAQTHLQGQLTLLQNIGDLDVKIKLANDNHEDTTALTQQRNALAAQLDLPTETIAGVQDQLAAVAKKIADLNVAIKSDADTIKTLTAVVQQRQQSLLVTFSAVAQTLQTGDGDFARSADRSARLEIGFDDLEETADRFRDEDVRQSEVDNDNRRSNERLKDKKRDPGALAAGLAAGVSDAFSALQGVVDTPVAVEQNRSVTSGERIRLHL